MEKLSQRIKYLGACISFRIIFKPDQNFLQASLSKANSNLISSQYNFINDKTNN